MGHVLDFLEDFTNDWVNWLGETDKDHIGKDTVYEGARCPFAKKAKDDGKISLSNDISSGFDVIHIDPWKECSSIEEGIKKTQELIEHCMSQNPSVCFEVGTEESIFPYTPNDLDKILTELKAGLGKHFQNIKYAVIQSGVKISGTNNVGNFDAEILKQMITDMNLTQVQLS